MANRIFGIIGWIGTVLVFAAVAARLYTPPWGWWNDQYATYMAWAGLASVLIYMAGQWRDVAEFYKGRGARYGTMSLVSIVVFLGILIAVNYLSIRQNKRWDFTANQVYSLSDQTIKILKELKESVKFVVFERADRVETHKSRLEEFTYQSSQVQTEFVDPDRDPLRAEALKLDTLPTIVLEYQGRTEKATSSEELALVNALIKVTSNQTRKVYFTQGHGEKDTAVTERLGYGTIAQALAADNYVVEQLVLIQQKTVPADATVVVIAGPSTDFFQPEMDALNAYVARGGKVLVLLDPLTKPGQAAHPLLQQFLADWGITAGNNVVIDASGMGQMLGTNDASLPVVVDYPSHPITAGFRRAFTGYPLARSMSPIEGGSNGHTAQPFIATSAQSWAEADLASLATGQVGLNPDKGDTQGPVTLGAVSSAPATDVPPAAANVTPGAPDAPKTPESRVAAIGDSDFAANFALAIPGNRDLFMNTVSWLAQREDLIGIRPREPEDRRLTLTADQQQRIMLLCLFVIPGIVFASGIYTWWRRR
jgi:ABC-type uncharacterized transport system involved in gliding motility auxiliary subunit